MFEQVFKNIDNILRKDAGCSSELDYTEQTSWILFLKYLDDLERERQQKAELVGKKYEYIIDKPYRWESWAAPKTADGTFDHNKPVSGDDAFKKQRSFDRWWPTSHFRDDRNVWPSEAVKEAFKAGWSARDSGEELYLIEDFIIEQRG